MAISTIEGLIQRFFVVYEVDTDARTVVGTIDDYNLSNDAARKMKHQLMSAELDQESISMLRIETPISAAAKCSPEDTFDIDEGIRTVKIKLNEKIDKARESAFLRYYDYISKHLLAAEKCLKKYAVTDKPADAIASLHSTLVHGYGAGYK